MSREEPRPTNSVEFPSAEKLRIYGDMAFLAFRSQRHAEMPLGLLRESIEPPVELGQFRIFRFDEIPRGVFTWARLSAEAEQAYVTTGRLDPNDWNSGDRLWIIDLIAPYRGLARGMVRWITQPGNFTDKDFRFRRVLGKSQTRRIVHIDFHRPEGLSRVYDDAKAYLDAVA
ncbi:toxin-activating lysine-acyltransferase [Frigidibacter sp. ROC022]|uniref:toxin-activating lysine-acyltransferase n=1 Tax=Frigidibacter sp. ROC022 TaxID=2971796 RepID=UPI00215AE868|nr:toxin-activating lysine-acyltransferase [Frigidibacter sp. ROC022]MCR8724457.1 toxin-activating lysine-acyltransferase [Frigidibacter sp. ROC022]